MVASRSFGWTLFLDFLLLDFVTTSGLPGVEGLGTASEVMGAPLAWCLADRMRFLYWAYAAKIPWAVQ